jgi:hypothetical protein
MFLEALVTHEELRALLVSALPFTILLDDTGGSHYLALGDLIEIAIVPGIGVRLTCRALLHWPLLGIDTPLTLNALRVLLVPEVTPSPTGEGLTFRIVLEHVDISGVPSALDETISHAVNARLAARHLQLSWDFSRTFARLVPLPNLLEPLESLSIRAAWGKVKITEDALVFALSLHNTLVRRGDAPDAASAGSSPPPLARTDEPRSLVKGSPVAAPSLAAAAIFGLAAGVAFFALRSATSRW